MENKFGQLNMTTKITLVPNWTQTPLADPGFGQGGSEILSEILPT